MAAGTEQVAELARRTMLRISELARRTRVSRATIQYYLREGLLPAPVKTARTMAYYDISCVDRVLLIKDLQRRYLPLRVIRKLVEEPGQGAAGSRGLAAMAAVGEHMRTALQPAERPLTREEVPVETRITDDALEALERLGVVNAQRVWDKEVFGPADAAILRAVGKLQAAGVTKEVGFRVADVRMYRDAMVGLLAKEVAAFGRSAASKRSTREMVRLGIAAATGATELLMAIRTKLIADFMTAALPSRTARPKGAKPRSKRGQRGQRD
jgi:DNA-binding transcriptional MerR regulator